MSVRQLKDGRWVVEWKEGRSGRKRYFGRGLDAERKAREYDASLGLRPTRPRNDQEGYLVWEIVDAYLEHRQFGPKGRHNATHYIKGLWPLMNIPAIKLCDTDLDRYIQERSRTVSAASIRRELVLLHAALNFAARRRPPLLPLNPVQGYRSPKAQPEILLPPTPDEIRAVLKVAPEHLRRAILLAYYLGLRPGPVELFSLRWEDARLGEGLILVRSAHKGGPAHRFVPIHPELAAEMRQWIEDGNPYLVHWHGKPIEAIRISWRKALKRAGITRRIRLYDIRHAFVTRALAEGLPIKAVSEIVGSSPQTIMHHYQHVTQALHRSVVQAIPSLVGKIPTKPRRASTLKLVKK